MNDGCSMHCIMHEIGINVIYETPSVLLYDDWCTMLIDGQEIHTGGELLS